MGLGIYMRFEGVTIHADNVGAATTAAVVATREHYPWTPKPRHLNGTLADILEHWTITTEQPDGVEGTVLTGHEGENWQPEYAQLFAMLAPFVQDGGIISCFSDDLGETPWRYVFRDGQCYYQDATFTWGTPGEVVAL